MRKRSMIFKVSYSSNIRCTSLNLQLSCWLPIYELYSLALFYSVWLTHLKLNISEPVSTSLNNEGEQEYPEHQDTKEDWFKAIKLIISTEENTATARYL